MNNEQSFGMSEIANQEYKAQKETKTVAEGAFTPKELKIIESRRRILSTLVFFIGKDFRIPVELNEPGAGWHWDIKNNVIRVDPIDLLNKPMDYLRFVISHEGGHRRISRTKFIPLDIWQKPGFSTMMNVIEDPRDNNFVAENYPKFRALMALAYNTDLDLEGKLDEKAKNKLGQVPRFMQAGFEYIKQWFREQKGEEFAIDERLPAEVRDVLIKTLESARESWWTYPSRKEADRSEELITRYAEVSYRINLERVWPEFKKLIEEDLKDQEMQEFLQDMQKDKQQGNEHMPQELKDKLSPEQQKELEEAIDKAIEEMEKNRQSDKQPKEDSGGDKENEKTGESQRDGNTQGKNTASNTEGVKDKEAGGDQSGGTTGNQEDSEESSQGEGEPTTRPIDLDSLSPELKQKIKEYIDSLPEDKKRELNQKAQKSISEFESEINEEIEGKMTKDSEDSAEDGSDEDSKGQGAGGSPQFEGKPPEKSLDVDRSLLTYKERIRKELEKDANLYEKARREVLPIIDKLESDLRRIFLERQARKWENGFPSGKRINIKKRIQEKALSIPAMESMAWQRRNLPREKDYAISLLVDLSGSMWANKKIQDTFRAVVVLAEVLNRLDINIEISGFNDQYFDYQGFGEDMSNTVRERLGGMIKEAENSMCKNCGREHSVTDLGWATEIAAGRLSAPTADNKFLITLSDGELEESRLHPRSDYELGQVLSDVEKTGDIKLVGLGVGRGTQQMTVHYPNSLSVENVDEMAEKLADLIEEAIVNYDQF